MASAPAAAAALGAECEKANTAFTKLIDSIIDSEEEGSPYKTELIALKKIHDDIVRIISEDGVGYTEAYVNKWKEQYGHITSEGGRNNDLKEPAEVEERTAELEKIMEAHNLLLKVCGVLSNNSSNNNAAVGGAGGPRRRKSRKNSRRGNKRRGNSRRGNKRRGNSRRGNKHRANKRSTRRNTRKH